MAKAPQPKDQEGGLTWVTIADFSPGIVSQTRHSYTASTNAPVPYDKPGAAQVEGTQGCLALPNGGLAPGPGISNTYSMASLLGSSAVTYINGAFINELLSSDEIVFGLENVLAGTRTFLLESWLSANGMFTAIFGRAATSSADTSISGLTGGATRVNLTAPYETAGTPVLALAYSFKGASTTQYNWLYPNPAALGSPGTGNLSTAYGGLMVCHQNRIIVLAAQAYAYIGTVGSVNTVQVNNENFYYTDPPNSPQMGAQDEVFIQEYPYGVGATGSVSAGELFLVKHRGGGYVISGDLNAPTVTFLGGVQPTYQTVNSTANTPIGIIYASFQNGVWAWNGSNVSVKISDQLNDDFWQLTSLPPATTGGSPLVSFEAVLWGNYVICTNGWMYDYVKSSWWKLTPSSFAPLFVLVGEYGNVLYTLPASVSTAAPTGIAAYSYSTPATTFSWTSYPMGASIDRMLAPDRVAVRAQGSGTVTITLTGLSGTTTVTSPTTLTFNSTSQPQLLEASVGNVLAHDITINIVSTAASTGPAPTVYSVSVGYHETTPASAS